MKQHLSLLLRILLCQLSLLPADAVSEKSFGKADLLIPQFDLPINLRIPDYYYAKAPMISTALTDSIDFLVSKDVPFRLFYNFTRSIPATILFKLYRHVQNRFVWLVVLAIVESPSELIS